MNHCFDNLSPPDPTIAYYCFNNVVSTKFTHLMKLVLFVRKFPEVMDVIQQLCLNNPNCINDVNTVGVSALMIAVANVTHYSHNDCIKCLINNGANVNLSTVYTNSLNLACNNWTTNGSNFETIKLLLDGGANINSTPIDTVSIFEIVCIYNNTTELFNLLMHYNLDINHFSAIGRSILSSVCKYVDIFSSDLVVKSLIKNGANINSRDIYGQTSLMILCDRLKWTGRAKMIKTLLEHGSDPNLKDNYGNTTLMYLLKNKLVQEDCDVLVLLIMSSNKSLLYKNNDNTTSYDIYIQREYLLLDDYYLSTLKDDARINNTKSAIK